MVGDEYYMRQFIGDEHKSVVDITVDRLIRYLQDEGLDDGDRLPNERTLSELLDVGRSTLREALQRLSARNVLEIKRGVGVFVSYKQYYHAEAAADYSWSNCAVCAENRRSAARRDNADASFDFECHSFRRWRRSLRCHVSPFDLQP